MAEVGYYPKIPGLSAMDNVFIGIGELPYMHLTLQGRLMAETGSNFSCDNEEAFDRIAYALKTTGYIILADCLPLALCEALNVQSILGVDELKRAGVGRGQGYLLDGLIRTDGIRWLRPDSPAEIAFLAWMEQLRLGLNRRLFLGLFDYESHFAVYDAGAFYRKHLDAFQGVPNRVLSTVFYLNQYWMPDDCGELLIYSPHDDTLMETVPPDLATMVIFLSAVFPHEVAVTHRKRYSIAGWFRGR